MLFRLVFIIMLIVAVIELETGKDILDPWGETTIGFVHVQIAVIVNIVEPNIPESILSLIFLDNFLVLLVDLILPILLTFYDLQNVKCNIPSHSKQNEPNNYPLEYV